MEDRHRMAVGVTGNAVSIFFYAAPTLTFTRIIRKKSTEEFSCVPYIIALPVCSLYTWYGLPVVSYKWENLSLVPVNGVGILLEMSYILTYFWFASAREKASYYISINSPYWFASAREKKKVAMMTVPVILVICVTATISAFIFHNHHNRKLFVGSVGLVSSVAMYASPLVAMKRVIQTKSVEFMPFYLSFFTFLASSLWLAYGLLSHDIVLASPNFIDTPLAIFQLVLYFEYRNKEIVEEPRKSDTEWCGHQCPSPRASGATLGSHGSPTSLHRLMVK